ncbi:MAG: hypothetical protein BWY70_01203 [Bacteroidetes bacterium ADurb.Bin408]|nr:MAG: hypothetical protein BWY70_01203 [Bacteroidetes bacterium ADurb.Bin408]
MEKKYIIAQIRNLLETIVEQSEVICSYENKIPQIELDIVKVNIRELYESYIQLDKANHKSEKPAVEPVAQIVPEKKSIQPEIIPVVPAENIPEKTIQPDNTPIVETKSEPLTEFKEKPTIIQPPVEQKPEKTPLKTTPPADNVTKKAADLFSDSPTIIEKFKTDSQSINDKIAQSKSDASLSAKMKESPVADLKKAIGINEKFRFVNELFEGNLSDYNATIEKLNTIGNAPDALKYLGELAAKYKWAPESNSLSNLKDLIRRRYL